MKERINGIAINLKQLTAHELEALMKMAEKRHEAAHQDLDKLNDEAVRRSSNVIAFPK